MEGVITVQETRSDVDALKDWRNKEAQRIIQQNNTEKIIDKVAEVTKTVVGIAGTVATVILSVCPVDGPFGELATVLATPALIKAVDAGKDLLKGIFVKKDTNQINAAMASLSGDIKDITIADKDYVKTHGIQRAGQASLNAPVEPVKSVKI